MKRIAVITGGTSGIGASFAAKLAAQGYDLLVTGRREAKIQYFADELRERFNVSIKVVIVELSDPAQLPTLVDEILTLPHVDILINNAGLGLAASFCEYESSHTSMLLAHVSAPLRLMRAVIPGMISRKAGAIINVASVAAFFPTAKGATYSATKGVLVSITESLHMELSGFKIRMQALCPGLTTTDFHDRERTDGREIRRKYPFKWADSDKLVEKSLRHLGKKRIVFIPGLANKLLVLSSRLIPRHLYYKLAIAARGR